MACKTKQSAASAEADKQKEKELKEQIISNVKMDIVRTFGPAGYETYAPTVMIDVHRGVANCVINAVVPLSVIVDRTTDAVGDLLSGSKSNA